MQALDVQMHGAVHRADQHFAGLYAAVADPTPARCRTSRRVLELKDKRFH
jgi:hypothetical protein